MNRLPPLALLLIFAAGDAAAARNEVPSIDQRLTRIENILRNQSLSDILLQLQQLRQEVQQLRGELEVQKHALDAMGKRQRDLYLDLDRRLSQSPAPLQQPVEPVPPATEAAPAEAVPRQASAEPPPPAVPPGDPAREKAAYLDAFNLLKQGNYAESITAFRDFLGAYPRGEYADNAQYWLGEASYVTRDFATAKADFDQVLELFPNSSKVPGAMLKIGYIHHEQREWDQARDILNRLIEQYPGSTEARLARQRLDRMGR